MDNLVMSSATVGIVISLLAYEIGLAAQRKWKLAVLNPLLISIVLVIAFLLVFHVDYESYNLSAKYLSYLLTPATVCLAIPLYLQLDLLKKKYPCDPGRSFFGSACKPWFRTCHVRAFWPGSRGICDYAAEVHHNSDRYGRFGGTWWICDNFCGSDHHHRSSWKYVSGIYLQAGSY